MTPTRKLINNLKYLNEGNLNSSLLNITFKDINFSKLLTNKNIKELLIWAHPYKGTISLYIGDDYNKKFFKDIGTFSNSFVNKVLNNKLSKDDLANQLVPLVKEVLLMENIIIPNSIAFYLQVDTSTPISLNNSAVPQSGSSFVVLREIKLKASDGTNLKQTKLGGKPNWIQNDNTPKCPSCKQKMSFVGQIDSFDDDWHTLKGDNRYYFSDEGMLYIFFPYCDCGEDPVLISQFY